MKGMVNDALSPGFLVALSQFPCGLKGGSEALSAHIRLTFTLCRMTERCATSPECDTGPSTTTPRPAGPGPLPLIIATHPAQSQEIWINPGSVCIRNKTICIWKLLKQGF